MLRWRYYKGKDVIDCYATDSLYFMNILVKAENFECCNFEDSPFKGENEVKVLNTIRELNRSYKRYKDDVELLKKF